jgi:hypothetical protein
MRKLILALIILGMLFAGCEVKEGTQIASDKLYYENYVDYTAEELQDIFWKHEKKFDYIVQVIKTLKYENFTIVIGDEKKGNLLFFVRGTEEIEFTDGSNLGYEKDNLFEKYVNDILVGKRFCRIEFVKGCPSVNFGSNFPIYYEEGTPAIDKTEWGGSLKENWFYYIQSYV